MDISTMSVNVIDKSISINGEGHICSADYFPQIDSNIVALHWHPEKQGRCKGSVSRHVGGGEGIDDFQLFEPFVKAWEEAKERKHARSALIEAEANGAFDEPVTAEDTETDLPRFLKAPEQTVSPEMQARASDFDKRVEEAVAEARKSIDASKSDARISELEQRIDAAVKDMKAYVASEIASVMRRLGQ